jgi:hypothetical protein
MRNANLKIEAGSARAVPDRSLLTATGLPAFAALAALAALAAMLLSGCGSTGGKPGPAGAGAQAGSASVKVEGAGDLADVARGIKTDEDQLILDLMLGYRMLLLSGPDARTLDKETVKKSRNAYDRLENVLRHGGVNAQDGGERVYTITNETKLSLQEVIRSASAAAEKAAQEGDWDKARERWKEIAQSRQAMTFTLEEAQWGLVLSDALQSALPDSTKRRLKSVNESYMADIGHEEIGKQVKTLLETVPDVKLQRELKKLANRSWEKDKKAGRISAQTQQAQAAAALAGTVPPGSEPPESRPGPEASAAGQSQAGQPGPEAAAIASEADSLASKGKYVAALKALEKAGPDQSWVKDKKSALGERFCEEKRRSAANSFKDFKKATADSVKRIHLRRTASDLDSCLFYFPDMAVSQKVRKNRDMVESELKKLK